MSEKAVFTEQENQVFNYLFALDVNDRTEKKKSGKTTLSYLSWAWAWAEIKKKYPNVSYEVERFGESRKPYLNDEDLGYMVFTKVTIEGQTNEMWLPVIDGSNKAMKSKPYTYQVINWTDNKRDGYTDKEVEQASMFDINKTIMRCLVKNLAMFGLGLYIYAGEDLPEIPITFISAAQLGELKVKAKELAGLSGSQDEKIIKRLCDMANVDSLMNLPEQFYDGALNQLNDWKKAYQKPKETATKDIEWGTK